MVTSSTLRLVCLLAALLLPGPVLGAGNNGPDRQPVVLTLPAETILASLQKVLPLDIPSQNRQLQGDITVESLDRLVIRDNVITVHGVLSGRNLMVVTTFGGQDLQIRVGEVRLPLTCDLLTRFDPGRRKLFVTPRFTDSTAKGNQNQDPMASLLSALGGREYQVDLDALETINIRVGAKSIPIAMDPVNIAGLDNALIFHLQPRVGAPRR